MSVKYDGADPTMIEIDVSAIIRSRGEWLRGISYGNCSKADFIDKMKALHPYLSSMSKNLFLKVVNGELETPEGMRQYQQILTMLRAVQTGKKTQSEMDVIFGKEQADKYVTPLINKLNAKPPSVKE